MKELDCVKIVRLLQMNRSFDGTKNIKRTPKVGDIGAVVHLAEKFCIVEKIDSDGYTVWLADFLIDELEIYE